MKSMSRQEFVAHLRRWRTKTSIFIISNFLFFYWSLLFMNFIMLMFNYSRKSSGFSRGASIYRGVTRLDNVVHKLLLILFWYSHAIILFLPIWTGIISMEDGRLVSAVLLETRIFTLVPSVCSLNQKLEPCFFLKIN